MIASPLLFLSALHCRYDGPIVPDVVRSVTTAPSPSFYNPAERASRDAVRLLAAIRQDRAPGSGLQFR
ncbi:MAG: hypothetical protein M3O22_06530 [Pseudomonadota bacterium]|nr:hypothetical protein [Pseudomonadota bacterium]